MHCSTECHCRRVAIAQDEHALCRPRSADSLPSRAGGGQCRTVVSGAATCVSRLRETNTPRVVCALRALSPAELAKRNAVRKLRRLPQAHRYHARRTRQVLSALCKNTPSQAGGGQRRTAATSAPLTRRDHARRAHHVSSALCSRSPQQYWRRVAPQGSTKCHHWHVAIARDDHATGTRHLRSPRTLPSRAGGGQRRTAALSAKACASQSRETSTPCAV